MRFTGLVPFAVAASLAAILPSSSRATIIETVVDGEPVVQDTNSGLEWLRVTQTLQYTYSQVAAGAGEFLERGWRHATTAEICALFGEFAYQQFDCPGELLLEPSLIAQSATRIMGITSDNRPLGSRDSRAFFDAGGGNIGLALISYYYPWQQSILSVQTGGGYSSANRGSFLVRRTVNEPALAPAAFLLGAACLGATA